MVRELDNNGQQQSAAGNRGNSTNERQDSFNELSELSLEERMAVADQIGVPVNNAGDAAATGAMRGSDDSSAEWNEQVKKEGTGDNTDR